MVEIHTRNSEKSRQDFVGSGQAIMNDVTRILNQIQDHGAGASEDLLPLVYDELRRLAAARLANEKPGQTLQATALVHEAYLRLVGGDEDQSWDSRGHFFSAAAEAMRRLLVERYRAKATQKRGGGFDRVELYDADGGQVEHTFDTLALDEAIGQLAEEDPDTANLVKLRIFAGLSVVDAGNALGIPRTSAFRTWTYGQTWLRMRLANEDID